MRQSTVRSNGDVDARIIILPYKGEIMQVKTLFKNYRITKSKLSVNAVQAGQTFQIAPRFECKLTGNDKEFSAMLSVGIEQTAQNKTPFDLSATIEGAFAIGANLQNDREGQLRLAVETLFPYLRAFVSNLTALSALPPFILPLIDVEQMVSSMRSQDEMVN